MVQIIPRANPTFGEQVASGLNRGVQQGTEHFMDLAKMRSQHAMQQKSQQDKLKGEYQADQKNFEKIKDAFGEKFADVWLSTGQGERTALTKAALEARYRGIDLDQILGGSSGRKNTESQQEIPQEKIAPEKAVSRELNEIKQTQDEGLTPAEKVARSKERYSTGLDQYREAGTKLRSSTRDKERLDILESLNKNDKLPKDLARLNVDKEGSLKFPFLASADAQRYVKTLNEFSSGAKDTFGSRVTNFDLSQYLKRFPTLMNSTEGRKQLLDQMKIVNQINSLYYKNLKNVYDKAGGVRSIDADTAERLAEQLSEEKVSQLSEKFNQIGQFSSKPAASEFKGKKIIDEDTGEIFISDGENWIPGE